MRMLYVAQRPSVRFAKAVDGYLNGKESTIVLSSRNSLPSDLTGFDGVCLVGPQRGIFENQGYLSFFADKAQRDGVPPVLLVSKPKQTLPESVLSKLGGVLRTRDRTSQYVAMEIEKYLRGEASSIRTSGL
jgi:hypothetical protein